ncbi:MAG: YihY/virulence factor BrkB family protein [Lachnospiraceae bacterium]|nr:YihY/virulence factor BrkB family protein [Lachnospiraceae bacterium]
MNIFMYKNGKNSFFKKIYILSNEIKDNHLDVYSASAAFFMFISIIPFFIALFSLVPYTPMSKQDILDLSSLLPKEFDILIQVVTAESYVRSFARLWISLIVGVWSASRGVMYITKGLNEINNVREKRNYFVLRLWASIYTLFIIIALIVLLIFGVFGKKILEVVRAHLPKMPGDVSNVLSTIIDFRILITIACLFILFVFMFTVLPSKNTEILYQLPGSFICAFSWWIFTKLFSFFTSIFTVFSMYGSLATAVASMLWMYCCMYIMFICAEINIHFADVMIEYIKKKKSKRERSVQESLRK